MHNVMIPQHAGNQPGARGMDACRPEAAASPPALPKVWAKGTGRSGGSPTGFSSRRAASRGQAWLNSGLRLLANASMPSFCPGVPNSDWKVRRSKRMPSDSVVS